MEPPWSGRAGIQRRIPMKKLVLLLIASALVSPAFAEPRSANSTESGANAQAIAAAQAAPTDQPVG